MPEVGEELFGFRLLAELGRGSFGRVFLARQGELADRPVALKVAANVLGESRKLAQLQHTNVVPVYSVHRAGDVHAICMPFLGSVTLAGVLAELRGRQEAPASAQALVETIHHCRSVSQVGHGADVPDASGSPRRAEGAVGPWGELIGRSYVAAALWLVGRLAAGAGARARARHRPPRPQAGQRPADRRR